MRMRHIVLGSLLILGAAVPMAARQQADADRVAVPLSDPSRPGLIDVSLVQGSITVRGANRKDVSVIAHPEADRPSRRYGVSKFLWRRCCHHCSRCRRGRPLRTTPR